MIATYGPGRRNCRFDVVEIATLDEWPHALFPGHLLLCMDARNVTTEALATLVARLTRGGLGAVHCHGPGSERVRDVFDQLDVWFEVEDDHDRFADTLFAFAMFAPPEPHPLPRVRTVVLVDQPDRARDVHRWLPVFCERR